MEKEAVEGKNTTTTALQQRTNSTLFSGIAPFHATNQSRATQDDS